MPSDPYSRIYWRFIDDHPTVYNDDRIFAAWMRLLIQAEGLYPASAPLPRWLKTSVLKALVDDGVVDLVGGDRYRIHGLVAEREKRAAQAGAAGIGRVDAPRDEHGRFLTGPAAVVPDRGPDAGPAAQVHGSPASKAEQSKDEQGNSEPSNTDAGAVDEQPEFPVLQWLSQHGCYIREGNGFHQDLVLTVERFGSEAVLAQMESLSEQGVMDGDIKGFVFGTKDLLYRSGRQQAAVEAEDTSRSEKEQARQRASLEKELAFLESTSEDLREKHYPGRLATVRRLLSGLRVVA